MVRALLLDLGGTLIERRRERDCVRWWAAQGRRMDPDRCAAAVYRADRVFMEGQPRLWRLQGGEFTERYWRLVHQMLGLPAPPADVCAAWGGPWVRFADAFPALDRARRGGLGLGLVSNWDADGWDVLRATELDRRFGCVAFSAHVGCAKPDPDIFLWAARRLRVSPRECVHVGDNYWDDALGAAAAGMGAILLHRHPEWAPLPAARPGISVAADLEAAVRGIAGAAGPRAVATA